MQSSPAQPQLQYYQYMLHFLLPGVIHTLRVLTSISVYKYESSFQDAMYIKKYLYKISLTCNECSKYRRNIIGYVIFYYLEVEHEREN